MTPVANQSERKTNLDDTKKQLTPRFEKIIAAYATAASAAAGVAMLTAPAAEAKVVYTKTNVTITSSYELDLNHDGVPDFDINFCFCLPHGVRLQLGLPVPGNLPREQASSPDAAADLPNGALIGPGQAFTSYTSGYGGVFMALASSYGTAAFSNGPWIGASKRYLGLKFMIHGEVHYGWARLTVTKHLDRVVLTGYAYETTPNKALPAGATTDAAQGEVSPASLPATVLQGPSLGLLARGADALDVWRRDPLAS